MNSRGRLPRGRGQQEMKWLARLDMSPARRQVARRTRDVASGGVPLPPGPRAQGLTRPPGVRANLPEIPGPPAARLRDLH